MRRDVVVVIVMSLVVAACSGTSADPTGSSADTGTGSTEVESPSEFEDFFSQVPLVPGVLSIEPSWIQPGDAITIRGLPAESTLVHHLPDGTTQDIAIGGNGATLTIDAAAPEGLHGFFATTPDGVPTVGSVRVSSGPGIAIRLEGESLHTEAFGIDPSTRVLLQIGSGTSVGFFEAVAADGLIPAGVDPGTPLSDFLDGPLRLPDGAPGDVVLMVLDPSGEDAALLSNTIRRQTCEEPATVTGDLGAAGEVRALWGAEGGSTSMRTEGPYEFEAGPGLVVVVEVPDAGAIVTHQVRTGCGRTVDTRDDTSGGIGSFSPDGLVGDSWIGSITGGVEAHIDDGLSVCDSFDGALVVVFADGPSFTIAVAATLDPYTGEGTYSPTAVFFDPDGGFHEFALDIVVMGDGELFGTFAGSGDVDGATTLIEGAFRCAPSGPSALAEDPWLFTAYQPAGGHDECRVGQVMIDDEAPSVGFAVARAVDRGVPLVTWGTNVDVQRLLQAAAADQLLGTGDGEAFMDQARTLVNADYIVWASIKSAPQLAPGRPWWLVVKAIDQDNARVVARYTRSGATIDELRSLDGFDTFLSDLVAAGICGFVEPSETMLAAGEEQEFAFAVVDLADETVSGAAIKIIETIDGRFDPGCGTMEPTEGTSSTDPFSATYRASEEVDQDCTEVARFSAELDTRWGPISTDGMKRPAEASISVGAKWEFIAQLTGTTADGEQVWRLGTEDEPGFFFVRESGLIVGGAPGSFDGVRSCELFENGVMTNKESPVPISGTWIGWINGRIVEADQTYYDFRLSGSEWDSNWPPLPEWCADPLMGPLGEGILELLAYHMDYALANPLRLTPEENTVEYAVLPDALPNGRFTVTIRPYVPKE